MSDHDAIDQAALASLYEVAGGDPAFVAEMIDAFLVEASELLETLQAAVAANDATALRRPAHSLKSSSATFGAMAMADLCQRLEELGKAGQFGGAADLVAACRDAFARVTEELIRLRPEG